MAMKRRGGGGTWPSKEARDLARAVTRAGGTVERTGQGHMKVTGPAGVAIVAARPDTNRGGRGVLQVWATVREQTGLDIEVRRG